MSKHDDPWHKPYGIRPVDHWPPQPEPQTLADYGKTWLIPARPRPEWLLQAAERMAEQAEADRVDVVLEVLRR